MNKPTIEIVGTGDLPQAVRNIFGDKLLNVHEKVMVPDANDGLSLLGYRVSFVDEGKNMLCNCLVGDDGETYYEDDVQEMAGEPLTSVPCRTNYCVCPDCLREIRGVVHVIEGESDEDRPYPSIEDAWDRVEGSGGLCGGDHCENPPQLVVWTRPDGHRSARRFESTMDASMTISGVVQWDPGLSEQGTKEVLTPDEIIDRYEALRVKSTGEFLRLDLDADTCEPKMPDGEFLLTNGEVLVNQLHHREVRYHGVVFVVCWDSAKKPVPDWGVYPKDPLPEPQSMWS